VEELTEQRRTADVFASTELSELLVRLSGAVSDAPQTQSLDAGGGTAGDMAASKVGTATTSAVADGASSVTVDTRPFPPSITSVVVTTLFSPNPSL